MFQALLGHWDQSSEQIKASAFIDQKSMGFLGKVNKKQVKLQMCHIVSWSDKYQGKNKVWCPERQGNVWRNQLCRMLWSLKERIKFSL